MPVNELSDVDPVAVSLVSKGANRKQFFLRKSAEDEEVFDLPATTRLLKSEDWSVVYCTVAEPGALEDAGMGADNSVPDRWASEEEIRKAAHRFARNGGLVNKMHESLDPYGTMVENAVALDDFEVNGETIAKGTWYIAIEPNDQGKEAIDKGEFTGVSVQGTGIRTEIEKRDFSAEDRKKLASEGKALPDGSFPIVTVADLRNAVSAYGRASDKQKAKAHIIRRAKALNATDELPDSWQVKKERVMEGLLRKLAEKAGIPTEEIEKAEESEEISKAATFGQRMAADKLNDELPRGMDLLRDTIFLAVHDPEVEDPMPLIRSSVGEFADWAEGLLANREGVTKQREVTPTPEGSTDKDGRTDSEMSLSTEEREEIDQLKKQVEELPEQVTQQLAKALGGGESEENPTPDSIAKAVGDLKGVTDQDELSKRVERIEGDIKKLAEGSSTQPEDGSGGGENEARQKVAKAYERQGLDPNLAGVL